MAEYAFKYAQDNNRQSVTAVHKVSQVPCLQCRSGCCRVQHLAQGHTTCHKTAPALLLKVPCMVSHAVMLLSPCYISFTSDCLDPAAVYTLKPAQAFVLCFKLTAHATASTVRTLQAACQHLHMGNT